MTCVDAVVVNCSASMLSLIYAFYEIFTDGPKVVDDMKRLLQEVFIQHYTQLQHECLRMRSPCYADVSLRYHWTYVHLVLPYRYPTSQIKNCAR